MLSLRRTRAVEQRSRQVEERLRIASEVHDVVVHSLAMINVQAGADGLGATRQICAELLDVKVLVLTTFNVDEYVFEALRSGASGFLLKDPEPVELLHALIVVAKGEALLAPSVT